MYAACCTRGVHRCYCLLPTYCERIDGHHCHGDCSRSETVGSRSGSFRVNCLSCLRAQLMPVRIRFGLAAIVVTGVLTAISPFGLADVSLHPNELEHIDFDL